MKKVFSRLTSVLICTLLFTSVAAAQDIAEQSAEIETLSESDDELLSDSFDDDEFNSLFDDAEDTGAIVTAPVETASVSQEKKGIALSGNLSAKVGGYAYYKPLDVSPAALFESVVGFTARPSDYFSIKGNVLVKFPQMTLDIYELYINYALWDVAYIMAGKKEIVWGNGRIFDTNILDDESDYEYDPDKLLLEKEKDLKKSKFSVMINVPFWKLNATALASYHGDVTSGETPNTGDISAAAMLEANIRNFSFDVFWRYWAINDTKRFDPAFGLNFNCQVRDFHLYFQYFTHYNAKTDTVLFPRMKYTASVWWATDQWANLGFVLEYQLVYDWKGYNPTAPSPSKGEFVKQYIACEGVWGRMFGSRFTTALKYFHDFYENYGDIMPGLKIHDVLPHADIDFGFPIYYGSRQKLGVGVQLKLDVSF